MTNKYVIVTGGSGFIGKSMIHQLLLDGYSVINIDMNPIKLSSLPSVDRNKIYEYTVDLSKSSELMGVFRFIKFTVCGDHIAGLIHLAAHKDLTESYSIPHSYYNNNINCTLNALTLTKYLNIPKFISASSAAVYPDDLIGMTNESDADLNKCASPYGYCKMICERLVIDTAKAWGFNAYNLRYSNPIGTIDGASIDLCTSMFGNILNHLHDGKFQIFGSDYDTEDGTCIRDYIDMHDLVFFHTHLLESNDIPDYDTINVGTGVPVSCLSACKIVKEFDPKFRYSMGPRREGDAAGSYLGVSKLKSYGYECKWNLKDSILHLLKWYDIITSKDNV